MADIILRGHKVAKGKAEGLALVSHEPISFAGGVDTQTGVVLEKDHELEGVSVAGKILVVPVTKGSTGAAFALSEAVRANAAPKGIINLRADPITAVGAIISEIPLIDRLDGNPMELIKTGDYVELDADVGIVKVRRT